MAITITHLKDKVSGPTIISDRRWYLTGEGPDQKVVEEGHPDSAFLLVAEGSEIEESVARRWGIHPEQLAAAKKAAQAAEAKAATEAKP